MVKAHGKVAFLSLNARSTKLPEYAKGFVGEKIPRTFFLAISQPLSVISFHVASIHVALSHIKRLVWQTVVNLLSMADCLGTHQASVSDGLDRFSLEPSYE